jgi:hypothetical protein
MARVLILDAMGLFYRQHFALHGSPSKAGKATPAAVQFSRTSDGLWTAGLYGCAPRWPRQQQQQRGPRFMFDFVEIHVSLHPSRYTKMLLRAMRELQPDAVIVAGEGHSALAAAANSVGGDSIQSADGNDSSVVIASSKFSHFRERLYPNYKVHRSAPPELLAAFPYVVVSDLIFMSCLRLPIRVRIIKMRLYVV